VVVLLQVQAGVEKLVGVHTFAPLGELLVPLLYS